MATFQRDILRRYSGVRILRPASQSRLSKLTCEPRSKPRGTAAFCGYGLVSVCGIWPRKRDSVPLSPTAVFGVSFLIGPKRGAPAFSTHCGWREGGRPRGERPELLFASSRDDECQPT